MPYKCIEQLCTAIKSKSHIINNLIIIHYPRSGHHCRFKNPLHCRILNRQWHTSSDEGCRSLETDTDLQETVSVPGSTRQCPVEQHYRFVVPTDSDGCFKSVGSWLKPTVLSKPTLSVHGSNRQCCSKYQCRFMDQTGSVLITISVGSWFRPTVLSKPTLSVCF